MQSGLKNFKEGIKKNRMELPKTIPYILMFISVLIYEFQLWDRWSLSIVNIIGIFCVFSELIPGLIEEINTKKLFLFAVGLLISILMIGVNLYSEFPAGVITDIKGISSWSMIWAIIFLISLCAVLIFKIRISRWSQEQWEQFKRLRQEQHLEIKKEWKEQRLLEIQKRNEIRTEKRNADLEIKKSIEKGRIQRKEYRQTQKEKESQPKMSISNMYAEKETETVQKHDDTYKSTGMGFANIAVSFLLHGGIVSIVAGLLFFFFVLPSQRNWTNAVHLWIDNVQALIKSLNDKDLTGQQAFLYYILYCL